jgi:hypothetical protein
VARRFWRGGARRRSVLGASAAWEGSCLSNVREPCERLPLGLLPCERFRAQTSGPHAPLRTARLRALFGGALLVALLFGKPLRSGATGELPGVGSSASAARATARIRPWLVSELERRNPRLGPLRSGRIADAVLRCTQTEKLPGLTPQLVLAVMLQESNARPGVTSRKGAVGLMQVMPSTYYELLDLRGSIGHLESNVEAGCLVLADDIRRLGLRDGISSYFWGGAIVSETYAKGVEMILRGLKTRARSPDPAG